MRSEWMGIEYTKSKSKEIIKTFKTCFRCAPAIAIAGGEEGEGEGK